MKIAIPKENITEDTTQIMSDYVFSEEEVTKAYLYAEDRAKKELFVRKNKGLRDDKIRFRHVKTNLARFS